jgi:hypothetical protein
MDYGERLIEMTDTKNHAASITGSLEGRVFTPGSMKEAAEAIELAFDYRGDVSLMLRSGESVAGYIFNRQNAGSDPYLELFPADRPDSRCILYRDIVTIAFTGEDTANGKSWESWVSKKESERRAEAEESKAVARTKGYL